MNELKIEIGTYKVANNSLLIAYGLGSCVAVFLYDKNNKIGGMGHILLPGKSNDDLPSNPIKYSDNIIEMMIKELVGLGVRKNNLIAKLAGGAHMFQFFMKPEKEPIGAKNIQAVKLKLKEEGIPILAEDVGENYGRTVIANTMTGILTIKTINYGIKNI